MADLQGKVAVVTGAGSGMGRAAAVAFAREGAKVLVADISGREAETASAIGAAAIPFRCDITNEAEVEAMMGAAVDAFGRIDAVLNVAGIAGGGLLGDHDMALFDKVLAVNMRGVMLCTKHAIRALTASGGGVILNWSSIAALGATSRTGAYAAAKAAVVSITRSAALEYGAAGIRTNAILPGPIVTEMWGPNPDPERVAARARSVPMGRTGTAEEVAELAVFLASDKASYINGAIIPIDGGQSCQMA